MAQAKTREENINVRLRNSQLCKYHLKWNCAKNDCNYAHCLEDLRPVPDGFERAEGHYWQGFGDRKSPDTIGVLKKYLIHQGGDAPEWVQECINHFDPQSRLPGASPAPEPKRRRQIEAASPAPEPKRPRGSVGAASSAPAVPNVSLSLSI